MATRKIVVSFPVEKEESGNRTDVTSRRAEIEDASDQDVLKAIQSVEAEGATDVVINIRGK